MTRKADRLALVEQIKAKGVTHPNVLAAMEAVPRELFVPAALQDRAYDDGPLPIGVGQTISQPFIVAYMTAALLGEASHLAKILEIGTGSGYQAAVLSKLCDAVYTVERIENLYTPTQNLLVQYATNIHCKLDDGQLGWAEFAPFNGIMITAAGAQVPEALKQQLADGGRLIMPVEISGQQVLQIVTKTGNTFHTENTEWVRFVPLLPGIIDSPE